MMNRMSNDEKRKGVYAEGRLAFAAHQRRDYNPYIKNNLILAVSWWHGWDTAAEESGGERLSYDKHEQTNQPGYSKP
jgi:hypothetical protein